MTVDVVAEVRLIDPGLLLLKAGCQFLLKGAIHIHAPCFSKCGDEEKIANNQHVICSHQDLACVVELEISSDSLRRSIT